MDMAVASLFKRKIRFERCDQTENGDSDWDEPLLRSKGYHYTTNLIENGESVGVDYASDLFIHKLKPLFLHIISTIRYEEETEIDCIIITVKVFEDDSGDYFDVVQYRFTFPNNDLVTTDTETWYYSFNNNIFKNKFSIYIESYVYMVNDYEEIDEEEESDEEEPYTPPVETYQQGCCVVCLESKPNILYLDCMHIAICGPCDRLKKTGRKNCDVCRAEISRRIKI